MAEPLDPPPSSFAAWHGRIEEQVKGLSSELTKLQGQIQHQFERSEQQSREAARESRSEWMSVMDRSQHTFVGMLQESQARMEKAMADRQARLDQEAHERLQREVAEKAEAKESTRRVNFLWTVGIVLLAILPMVFQYFLRKP